MEKTCKTCINLCNKRGKVEGCKKHRSEVQEMIKEIDKKLTVEEAVRIIQEEGYYDWERNEIGGNMIEIGELVRTKTGYIGIVENINDFRPPEAKICVDFNVPDLIFLGETDIVKHSKNIIDLIEVRRFY